MLIGFLLLWLVTAVGLMIVTMIVPGVSTKSTGDLLLAALILGLINALIRPLLLLLTWPLTVLSFGLFALLINAFMIQLTSLLVPGFEVKDFANALLAAVVMAFLAILGFIVLEWWLLDGVFWVSVGPVRSSVFY